MSTDKQFSSKLGLVAATVGSAVGLGNIWRFPAETQSNGGAAFLLLYVVCVMLLAVPVMLAEFSLGRGSRSDAIGSFKVLTPHSKWWIVGVLSVLVSFLISAYYLVVAGWTLEYLVESITGALYAGDGAKSSFMDKMDTYIYADWRPLLYTLILVAINVGVLMGGVQKGIERLSNVMMPLLFVILVAMLGVTLTLPDASAGVRYFLEPDFSKIDARTIISALGQALFSMSVGMGILVTYASYYPADTKLGKTSVTVAFTSVLVAVLVGLIIFPAVTSFGLQGEELKGTTLVFITLPEVFAGLPFPALWSSLFFLLLFVAALTSTVSICEVPIAMLEQRAGMSRRKAVLTVMGALIPFSVLCSLSMGSLSGFTVFGLNIFSLLDNVTTNIMLPVVAFLLCLYMGWVAPGKILRNQLTNDGTLRAAYTPLVLWAIRVFAPIALILILIYNYL